MAVVLQDACSPPLGRWHSYDTAPNMNSQLADLLVRYRWPLLAIAIVTWAVAVPLAQRVSFDRSIENMFSPEDPLLVSYQRLKRTFGGNEIVMAVYTDPALFESDASGLERLTKIRERCESVPGVRAVLSIDRPLALLRRAGVSESGLRTLFDNYTHSVDGRTVAVVCMLEPEGSSQTPRRQTIESLRTIVQNLPDGLRPGVLAGEPVMILDGFRYLERDGSRLGTWSTLLLALTIVLCFRSLRWVVIPIMVVQWTLWVTRAVLVASGLRLSMVSSMLTALVTVIGVATVVHVIVRFREGRSQGLDSQAAFRRAATLLSGPILWACGTDAVGFLALTKAQVGPIQDFGLMMAIGSLLVLPAVMLLTPALSIVYPSASIKTTWGERQLGTLLTRYARVIQQYPRGVVIATLLLTVLAVMGMSGLRVETDFSKNFRDDSPVVTSYRFVEDRLGGAGVLDIILPAPESLDWNYLQRVARLEERLRQELPPTSNADSGTGLTKVMSISDAVKASSPLDLESTPAIVRSGVVTASLTLMRGGMPAFMDALHGTDPGESGGHYFRIMLRSYERQPADTKLALIERVNQICLEEFPVTDPDSAPQVTGFFVLLANLVASVLRDQWTTFALALTGIGIMLALAFRSPLYALVAVIPNALPIILVLGGLGWTGGKVNMGVAMIAAASLGLSVDSAIHYITFFRRARAEGKPLADAIREVQNTVGLAMVFSTLALIVGFSVLCTSEFVPTVYFGLLVSLSMFGGLLGNLVLLPILLAGLQRLTRS